ncbi:MAG: hypothetical protein IT581_08070 [Verrucomicrobiales bacterium]|nr:hypothetical protein [Verrucomicrobiales bacterium]
MISHFNPNGLRRARTVLTLLALAAAGAWFSPRARAQATAAPPERMTYQGYVTDGNGNALGATNPKNYDIIFRIWNDATSTSAANRLWTEQQTVTVDKGYFSVLLGEGASIGESRPVLSTVFTNANASDRWIGLTVKGIGAGTPPADVDIAPRIRLLTSPYAFLASKALNVDGGALNSGTVSDSRLSANVALRSGGNTFTGNQVVNANVGIGIANPTNSLQVSGVAQVGYLTIEPGDGSNEGGEMLLKGAGANNNWHIDNIAGRLRMFSPGLGERFSLLGNGNLGIGTTAPTDRLHVAGSARVGYLNVEPQNAAGEGGEIALLGSGANSTWNIDVLNDRLRIFNSTSEWLSLKGNGNLGVGTTTPTAKLEVNGDIKIKGERPFAFKTIAVTGNTSVDTGWPTNKYVVSIAGFYAKDGDINEFGGSGNLLRCRAVPSTTGPNWLVEADFKTHNGEESWTITIMRVVRELVTDDSSF